MNSWDRDQIIAQLNKKLAERLVTRKKFADLIIDDPVKAFERSQHMFSEVAMEEAEQNLILYLKSCATDAQISDEIQQLICKYAQPQFSTNATSNLMHSYRANAWVNIREFLKWKWRHS